MCSSPSTVTLQAEAWYSRLIRKVVISSRMVTTIAGNGDGFLDGVGTLALFNGPAYLAFDPTGTYVLAVRSWLVAFVTHSPASRSLAQA